MPGIAVVALDGSATAEYVIPWATALARALGSRLVLAEAVEANGKQTEPALQAARHYLTGVADSLQSSGVPVETRAVAADQGIAPAIAALVEELGADLLCLATHGRTGVRRLVLGSVADTLARTVATSSLIINARDLSSGVEAPSIRRIIVPLDGSAAAEAALSTAQQLAGSLEATLDLVQVVPWAAAALASLPEGAIPTNLDEDLEQAATAYLEEVAARLPATPPVERHVLRGSAPDRLLNHAEQTQASLIAMTTRGRSGVARWALGSVADKVLRAGSTPLLLVRPPATEQEPAG